MIETEPDRARTASDFNQKGHGKRTPKAIRFSEAEWQCIKIAATKRGISIGGFVREAALTRATAVSGNETDALSSGIQELIKHTFRYAFILAAIKRDELIGNGHQQTVDDAVSQARKAQEELLARS